MDYRSRHLTEEAVTEQVYDEEYVINILPEVFNLNPIYGQLLNTDQKFRSTDQSANVTSRTNRKLTNEVSSPVKFIRDTNSKDFTRKQPQAINSFNTNFTFNKKINNFVFTDWITEMQWNYKYHRWRANEKVMDK